MTKLTSIPLTGAQFQISAGDYSATVTELGAGLREFRYRDRPVIAEYGPDELPPGASGQLLAPWPNRIDGGRYTIDGTSYQLDLSEPAHGNAIHGLTRWAGWQEAEHSAEAVRLRHALYGRTGYPFCLELTAEYRLSAAEGLQVSVTARNRGQPPRPVRHRLAPVPDHRDPGDRRMRAPASCRALAPGRRPRHPARPAGGRRRDPVRLPRAAPGGRHQDRSRVHRR